MIGLSKDELYEWVSHSHEAEFEYNGTTYILQPETKDDKEYLVIWDCTPNATKCLTRHEIIPEKEIPLDIIDAVLSEKCIDGKSFLEIENCITVTVIQ